MPTINFKITNLTCPACVKLSEMALRKIPSVTYAKVELETGVATVESERDISEEIIPALKKVDKKAIL